MALTPSTIKPAGKSKKNKKRVGRGNSSGKGTYSARGMKGQKARSGGKSGNKRRGFKSSLQKVPKVRGFNSLKATAQTVTLTFLEKIAAKNSEVTPVILAQNHIIKNAKKPVKIVATGELKKPVNIKGCLASKKAVELIEKAGGKIVF